MSLLDTLIENAGRKDEQANVALAEQITAKNDTRAVAELIGYLRHKNKNIPQDCIKILYEIGERKPDLIKAYANVFVDLLESQNNRLQWRAMTALDTITASAPDKIYAVLPKIISAAEKGSVITKDHGMNILIRLCSVPSYADNAFALLNEQLKTAAPNQLPMYAENALPVVKEKYIPVFRETLLSRLDDMEKESKRKRVEKVIRKLNT